MQLIRNWTGLRAARRGPVVVVGAFDGLHLGHQALIERARRHAEARGTGAMMMTFEPLPREFLQPQSPPARLTNFRERWRLLEGSGLQYLCVLRFDERLRSLSGEDFAGALAAACAASVVVVGHDFRFGCGGTATAQTLVALGKRHGFEVEIVAPVGSGGRISSTAVRAGLASGDFAAAARLLGRPYTMRGRVSRGERLGRTLGFPTANLRLKRRRAPLGGVFAVRVHGVAAGPWPGVASLGTRPTVDGVEPWLETFLFDFDADLYGCEIEVEFVAKIRDEERFASLDALVEKMHEDAREARRLLAHLELTARNPSG